MKKVLLSSILSLAIFMVMFILFFFPAIEPGYVSATNPAELVAKQQVTTEMSMTLGATTVTMLPSIPGMTGGVGTGTTTINVKTSNAAGYNVTIKNSTATGGKMMGDTAGGQILAYTPASPDTPEAWSVGANTAEFGYTVTAAAGDVVTGSLFNSKSDGTYYLPVTDAEKIMLNGATSTPAEGSVSSISFRAEITANPNPAIPSDWYVATTTLTMSTN